MSPVVAPQAHAPRACSCGRPIVANGECTECAAKRAVLQRRAAGPAPLGAVPPVVGEVLASPGHPLDPATRAEMEPPFGQDFSQVRVHTDAKAAESARAVDALAYTVGRDVVFGSGYFRPAAQDGRQLLAHELAHVVQQGRSARVAGVGAGAEQEADRAAARMVSGAPVGRLTAVAPALQRQHAGAAAHGKHPAAPKPKPLMLGSCTPVKDDCKPSKPWSVLQAEYQASCSATVSKGIGQLLGGSVPSAAANAKGVIDCFCIGPPLVAAELARARLGIGGPIASRVYQHFLSASGSDWTIDVADMLQRVAGVRAKIRAAMRSGARTGHTRVEQHDYKGVDDFLFAYGGIDCVQWSVGGAPKAKRTDATPVTISILDYYEFHPGRQGVSQCAHAACVELVARGQAKNFWTRGDATVTWGLLKS